MTNWQRDDNFKALKAKNANFSSKNNQCSSGIFHFQCDDVQPCLLNISKFRE